MKNKEIYTNDEKTLFKKLENEIDNGTYKTLESSKLDEKKKLFKEVANNTLKAKREKRYDSFLKSISTASVLIIDEIGYFNMSKEDANHFFQIISARYEKSSTILTSNLIFSQWSQVFGGDKIVTTATLDITHK